MKNRIIVEGYIHKVSDSKLEIISIRKSGYKDKLPILSIDKSINLVENNYYKVTGTLESKYLIGDDNLTHLVVGIVINKAELCTDSDDTNVVIITGIVDKDVIYRKTPLNKYISDILLNVSHNSSKMIIPCIAWETTAKLCYALDKGTKITVKGRLQSRDYVKVIDGNNITKTTIELSINKLILE